MAGVNFSGFNGFDFGQIVDITIQSESKPLETLQKQQQALQDKTAAFATLATSLGTLQTPAKALASATAFSNVTAVSSDTAIATVSAGTDALAGSYDLDVTQLAKAQVTASTNGYSLLTDVAADGGALSFTIDGSTTTAINVTANMTLAGLRDAINAQQSGVVASVVNTGSSNKLVIASRSTGLANGFTINNTLTNSGGVAITFGANSQDAQNAELTVNGVDISSASNTVTDALPGASIKLVKEGAATVEVTPDYGAIRESLKTLVAQYNKLRNYVSGQKMLNSSGQAGPLGGDSILRQSLNDTRDVLLGSNTNAGSLRYLAEVGIEVQQTGELKFTESKFNTMIAAHPSDVQSLFQGTGGGGVFGALDDRLDNLDGVDGVIKQTRDAIDTTLKSYRDRIVTQQLRLDLRREELTKMYAAADQAMSRLNSMSGQLQSLR